MVLGMHRSGTSLVAQMAARWGLFMGDELMPANKFNQDGYWEYNPLVNLNDKMLAYTGNTWYAPPYKVKVDLLVEIFGKEALALVAKMDDCQAHWCWKDPRLSVMLPFWKEILKDRKIIFIISIRNPLSIASSLKERDKMPHIAATALWEFNMLKIFDELHSGDTHIFLEYKRIIDHPDASCSRLFTFLNEALEVEKGVETFAEMRKAIRPELFHSKPMANLFIDPSQQELYQVLKTENPVANHTKREHRVLYDYEILTLYKKENYHKEKNLKTQLYFRKSDKPFSEQNSINGEYDQNTNQIHFNNETGLFSNVNALRFDPLNEWVSIKFYKLELFFKDKLIATITNFTSNGKIMSDGSLFFVTRDPQLFFNLQDYKGIDFDKAIFYQDFLMVGDDCKTFFAENPAIFLENLTKETDTGKSTDNSFNSLYNGISKNIGSLKKQVSNSNDVIEKKNQTIVRISQQLSESEKSALALKNKLLESQQLVNEKNRIIVEKSKAIKNLDIVVNEHIENIKILNGHINRNKLELQNGRLITEQNRKELLEIKLQLQSREIELNLNKKYYEKELLGISQKLMNIENELEREKKKYEKELLGINQQLKNKEYELESEKNRYEIELLEIKQQLKNWEDEITKENERVEKEMKVLNDTIQLLLINGRKKLEENYKKEYLKRSIKKIVELFFHPKKFYRFRRDTLEVLRSNLFDYNYYLSQNRDLYFTTVDLLQHYMFHGFREGRNPNPFFDTKYYLENNPDIKGTGVNPLLHFIRYGWKEGRKPNEIFDTKFYLDNNPDVKNAEVNPLFHYINFGWKEHRKPNEFFNAKNILEKNPDAKNYENPLLHYFHNEKKTKNISNVFQQFTNNIQNLPDKISYIPGNCKSDNSNPNVLVCAHSIGKNLYGGERSLLDIIEAFSKIKYNVTVAIPSTDNSGYIQLILKYSVKIAFFNYGWWKQSSNLDNRATELFSSIIKENHIDAVHVNTIMLREPLIAAKKLNIPGIVHAREIITHDPDLCKVIGQTSTQIISEVLKNSDYIIANSKATSLCFNKPEITFIIPNTTDISKFNISNNISDNEISIALISSNIPKKGINDFFAIASILQETTPFARFLLIGPENNYTKEYAERKNKGEFKNVEITGYISDSLDAIRRSNIVLNLSHFQESFGRTVLEAMAARRPVVAYNWGAVPELVTDGENGFLVPFADTNGIAECLRKLCNDVRLIVKMGQNGRIMAEKCYSQNSFAFNLHSAYQQILEEQNHSNKESLSLKLQHQSPTISVVVPNYNYSNYLDERINSIINQTVKPFEILFLDDCSSDSSVEKANKILTSSSIPFTIFTNEKNYGTYNQWKKGINEAKGDYVWIAEADDSSEPHFLEKMIQVFDDPLIVMAYCQSKIIDEKGEVLCNNNLYHTNDLSKIRWLKNYKETGVREVTDYLCYRNSIPNVSACLFKRESLVASISGIEKYLFCGDWFLYSNILLSGNIGYLAQSHNNFRRHKKSVTRNNIKSKTYLLELLSVKNRQFQNYPIHSNQLKRIKQFIDSDYQINGLNLNSNSREFKEFYENSKVLAKNRFRFAFVTTNHNSTNGGSELLWYETIKKLRFYGHDVILIIKKWDPEPEIFNELRFLGISVYFKNGEEYERLISFNPDLFVISTGDQDEGTEWFSTCKNSNIKYCIINHLTKEIKFWPVREDKLPLVKDGYLSAQKVFFTSWNNHRLMEERLNCKISNAEVFFNPFKVDKNINIPFPTFENGLQIAMPHRMLIVHKGQDLIIKLLSQNKWRSRNLTINLYGDGPDKGYLQELVKKHNLNNIHFYPRFSDLSKIWEKNHAILFSSYMEGMPIVLVEAMLCARVPIATDVGGNKELIDDNECGFIAPFPTIEDIDDALERAYSRSNDWETIGKKARERVLSYLPEEGPIDNFIHKLINCFK